MPFTLPDLPYAKDALAPFMSAETLDFHHGKHHQAYVTKLNELTAGGPLATATLEDIIVKTYNDESKAGIFNNASQHWNHIQFWGWMKPKGGGSIPGNLEKKIKEDFGSIDKFKEDFTNAGIGQFGSGWCWLVLEKGKLKVTKTANGVNPLCFGQQALLGCDVWEHSYYIDYRNKRADYLKAFLESLVNWESVAAGFEQGLKKAA
ncbi:MAG: superoxide dismutase [Alphaproteobacteria bacterium]|nr:MAG: superoxide dismutase [Alphaproteobacteria bacterium]